MIEHICKNIYIGNSKDAASFSDLRKYRIGAIINCAQELPIFSGKTLPYLHVKINPMHEFTFPEAYVIAGFYEKYKNKNILVHCHVGMERSPSVAILLLMYLGMSYNQAFKLVQNKRKEVNIRMFSNVKRSLNQLFGR